MQADKSSPTADVKMLGHKFKIDMIDRKTFQKLKNVTLRNTNTQAYVYSNKKPVDILGKFEAVIEPKGDMMCMRILCCYVLSSTEGRGVRNQVFARLEAPCEIACALTFARKNKF